MYLTKYTSKLFNIPFLLFFFSPTTSISDVDDSICVTTTTSTTHPIFPPCRIVTSSTLSTHNGVIVVGATIAPPWAIKTNKEPSLIQISTHLIKIESCPKLHKMVLHLWKQCLPRLFWWCQRIKNQAKS